MKHHHRRTDQEEPKYSNYASPADEELIAEGRRLYRDLETLWRAELQRPEPNATTLWMAYELMKLVEEGLCRLQP